MNRIDAFALIGAMVESSQSIEISAPMLNKLCKALHSNGLSYRLGVDDFIEVKELFPTHISVSRQLIKVNPDRKMMIRINRLIGINQTPDNITLLKKIIKDSLQ